MHLKRGVVLIWNELGAGNRAIWHARLQQERSVTVPRHVMDQRTFDSLTVSQSNNLRRAVPNRDQPRTGDSNPTALVAEEFIL